MDVDKILIVLSFARRLLGGTLPRCLIPVCFDFCLWREIVVSGSSTYIDLQFYVLVIRSLLFSFPSQDIFKLYFLPQKNFRKRVHIKLFLSIISNLMLKKVVRQAGCRQGNSIDVHMFGRS